MDHWQMQFFVNAFLLSVLIIIVILSIKTTVQNTAHIQRLQSEIRSLASVDLMRTYVQECIAKQSELSNL